MRDLWVNEKHETHCETIRVNMEWKHNEYGMEDFLEQKAKYYYEVHLVIFFLLSNTHLHTLTHTNIPYIVSNIN